MSLKIQMMTPEQSKERYKPSIWGPPIWFYLHSNAAKYPPSASLVRASRMKDLIVKIPGMVPCTVCIEIRTAPRNSAEPRSWLQF